jgi:hypothetical protein
LEFAKHGFIFCKVEGSTVGILLGEGKDATHPEMFANKILFHPKFLSVLISSEILRLYREKKQAKAAIFSSFNHYNS